MKRNYLKIKSSQIESKQKESKQTNPISQTLYKIGHEVHDGGETLQASYF